LNGTLVDPQALFNVRGLTAVITGGSGQLGRTMAHALAQAGIQVAVVSLHAETSGLAIGKSSTQETLTTEDVRQLLAEACEALPVEGKRVLVIIPGGTRTAPVPLFFRLLYELLGQRVAQLDYLIALGTHPPMSEEAVDQLVGVLAVERAEHYPRVRIFNHRWSQPEMLQTIGLISRQEADLSAHLNIIKVQKPFQRVLSVPSTMYDDLWTAAKAMYKTEPAIADGGEVIIYALRLTKISYTHGKLIDQVGYHVRDYFLKQRDRFKDVPGSILAHSTHVKGTGTYEKASGIETQRIQVTLATGIPEERCRRVNLGYADYRDINPQEWQDHEHAGMLLVPHAGEVLYCAPDLVLARSHKIEESYPRMKERSS